MKKTKKTEMLRTNGPV